MSASFYDLMRYAKTGIAAPDLTEYDKIKALAMCRAWFPEKTLSGVQPITFRSDGTALTAWSIAGNMLQTGTPTQENPITPQECGDLVASGSYAGKYQISITLAGLTHNIYLDEPLRKIGEYTDCVDEGGAVTRRIKRLALTGDEGWTLTSINAHGIVNFRYPGTIDDRLAQIGNVLSSHFPMSRSGNADVTNESVRITAQNILYLRCFESEVSTVSTLQQWLSDQYAAGTPVMIWYVLAEPTMDSVDVPALTTAKGSNTLAVSSSLQPSVVSITGRIR